MSRRKKTETTQIQLNSNNCNQGHFVYCGQRKCPHTECLRHNQNTPFNVLIFRRNFNPDNDCNCKDIVLERWG